MIILDVPRPTNANNHRRSAALPRRGQKVGVDKAAPGESYSHTFALGVQAVEECSRARLHSFQQGKAGWLATDDLRLSCSVIVRCPQPIVLRGALVFTTLRRHRALCAVIC